MRILIVDDESINRFILLHMLEEIGITDVYEAQTGREAVMLAKKVEPDLVLLDVMMPDMDGYETAKQLKKFNKDVYLPIIFITSLDNDETIVKCLEAGGDDFASKPFNKHILLAKVKAHGRTRELSRKTSIQNKELTYFRHSIEQEHEIIEHIFSKAIVNDPHAADYFDYRLFPAAEFSGDVFLCETSPNGGVYFLIGDFTGHGLASAIGALPVTRAFHAMTRKGLSVSEIAATLNSTLENLLPVNMFFAAAIVEVNKNGRRFNVWNGGMPNMLLQSPNGQLSERFISQHMALGILDRDEFDSKDEVFEVEEGSRLLAFTDGLIELSNEQGEMFGEEGLERSLVGNPTMTVEELLDLLRDFSGGHEPDDDITLMMFVCKPIEGVTKDHSVTTLPFAINVNFGPDELRDGDVLEHLIDMITSQLGFYSIRSTLFTVLTELYSNALEHGVLKLQSSLKSTADGFVEYYQNRHEALESLLEGNVEIKTKFDVRNRQLIISVEDSGDGFDVEMMEDQSIESEDAYGRGITMLKELCDVITYENNGRRAIAKITLYPQ